MWVSILLCITFINKSFSAQYAYENFKAVPLSGPSPTVNTGNPDLSEPLKYYDCYSIDGTSACEGMDSYYFPETGLFTKTSTSFDTYINTDVNNDSGILMALCPNAKIEHDLKKIAFRYSMYCGRYAYSQARWCPQNPDNVRANPKLSLCKRVCLQYAQSIADYGETVCKNTDNSVAEKIKTNIINKWCNLFSDEPGCFEGTTKEKSQCGYKSASYAYNDAQTYNPHNSCWYSEDPNAKKSMDELKKKAQDEQSQKEDIGGIKWKIAYPLGVIVIIGLLTGFFWKKQNDLYKSGYIPRNKTIYDYEFVPSSAKPSRDYVDDDFIEQFELELSKGVLNRKGSLAAKSFKNKNDKPKVYMVAIYNYRPHRDDELELNSGDRIRMEHEYEDGWAAGFNETTNKFGAFPLICCSTNIATNTGELPKRGKSSRNKAGVPIKKPIEPSPLSKGKKSYESSPLSRSNSEESLKKKKKSHESLSKKKKSHESLSKKKKSHESLSSKHSSKKKSSESLTTSHRAIRKSSNSSNISTS